MGGGSSKKKTVSTTTSIVPAADNVKLGGCESTDQIPNESVHQQLNNKTNDHTIESTQRQWQNQGGIVPPPKSTQRERATTHLIGSNFPRSASIPDDAFQLSVKEMDSGIKRNRYNHLEADQPGWLPCTHEICETWKLSQCGGCKIDLGLIRSNEEECLGNAASMEDALRSEVQPHVDLLHGLAISIEALLAFTYDHRCWEWPTWKIVRDIVVPATRETRCRYAELPATSSFFGPADVMISHCWGAKWGDLVCAACQGACIDRRVWIDIFAVRQWPGNQADLAFRGVIGKCNAVIVSVTPTDGLKEFLPLKQNRDTFMKSPEGEKAKTTIPFLRLWCVVELAAAHSQGIPIIIKGGHSKTTETGIVTYVQKNSGIVGMLENLQQLTDLESSSCAVPADKVREMGEICKLKGGIELVNKTVAGVIGGAAHSIEHNLMEVDAYICGEPIALKKLSMRSLSKGKEGRLADKVLRAACMGGRLNMVNELLDWWSETEEDDAQKKRRRQVWLRKLVDGGLAIKDSAAMGQLEVVDLLLTRVPDADVNKADAEGHTPLYMACQNGHEKVVDRLLKEKNIDINRATETHGATPLYIACQKGYTKVVARLLEETETIDVNFPMRESGMTPLFAACYDEEERTVIVDLLLKHPNIDVNQCATISQTTPINMACQYGHKEIVTRLLQQPFIDLNKVDIDGDSPLVNATKKFHFTIRDKLKLRAEWSSKFQVQFEDAITSDDPEKLENVLSSLKDVDVNSTLSTGTTALHTVCEKRSNKMFDKLMALEHINVNSQDQEGKTPLFIACEKGNVRMVGCLLRNKHVNVNLCSREKKLTPLNIASITGRVEIVRDLLEMHGDTIDLKRKDEQCCTPLTNAKRNNHAEIVTLLTNAHAPLYYACKAGGRFFFVFFFLFLFSIFH